MVLRMLIRKSTDSCSIFIHVEIDEEELQDLCTFSFMLPAGNPSGRTFHIVVDYV